jgi:hypothetical protein
VAVAEAVAGVVTVITVAEVVAVAGGGITDNSLPKLIISL